MTENIYNKMLIEMAKCIAAFYEDEGYQPDYSSITKEQYTEVIEEFFEKCNQNPDLETDA